MTTRTSTGTCRGLSGRGSTTRYGRRGTRRATPSSRRSRRSSKSSPMTRFSRPKRPLQVKKTLPIVGATPLHPFPPPSLPDPTSIPSSPGPAAQEPTHSPHLPTSSRQLSRSGAPLAPWSDSPPPSSLPRQWRWPAPVRYPLSPPRTHPIPLLLHPPLSPAAVGTPSLPSCPFSRPPPRQRQQTHHPLPAHPHTKRDARQGRPILYVVLTRVGSPPSSLRLRSVKICLEAHEKTQKQPQGEVSKAD